jgi:hypothetical protein
LVLALLVVEDVLDLQGHGLARPHVGDLAEPSICNEALLALRSSINASFIRKQIDLVARKGIWRGGLPLMVG